MLATQQGYHRERRFRESIRVSALGGSKGGRLQGTWDSAWPIIWFDNSTGTIQGGSQSVAHPSKKILSLIGCWDANIERCQLNDEQSSVANSKTSGEYVSLEAELSVEERKAFSAYLRKQAIGSDEFFDFEFVSKLQVDRYFKEAKLCIPALPGFARTQP
jgi:hypothetical protein